MLKPFPERYAGALADRNVREGLLSFQRSWRSGRDDRMAELEAKTGRTFDELRHELAEIKRAVIADWPAQIDRFTKMAETAGATVIRIPDAHSACEYIASACLDR